MGQIKSSSVEFFSNQEGEFLKVFYSGLIKDFPGVFPGRD